MAHWGTVAPKKKKQNTDHNVKFAFVKINYLCILPIRRTSSYFKRRTITSAHADVVIKQPTIKKGNSTNEISSNFIKYCTIRCRSQWSRGLRRRSTAARLLRSWARIPPGAWMFVCFECCVLSGRGLCDEMITRSEESYRLWCVVMCDLETSRMRRP